MKIHFPYFYLTTEPTNSSFGYHKVFEQKEHEQTKYDNFHTLIRLCIFIPIPIVIGVLSSLWRFLQKKGMLSSFKINSTQRFNEYT